MEAVLTWPVGRDNDYKPSPAPVVAYTVSTTFAAMVVAIVAAAVGELVRGIGTSVSGIWLIALTTLAVFAVGLQWHGRLHPLLERRKQVPRWWLLWRHRPLTAIGFGLMIGSGFLTHVKHATAYVLLATLLAAPSIATSALIGATYGFCRGATLIGTWLRDRRSTERPAWPVSAPASRSLNRALAVTGAASFASVLALLVTGGG